MTIFVILEESSLCLYYFLIMKYQEYLHDNIYKCTLKNQFDNNRMSLFDDPRDFY